MVKIHRPGAILAALIVCVCLAVGICAAARQQVSVVEPKGSIEGYWQGTLQTPDGAVRCVVKLQKSGDAYSGTYQISDHSADMLELSNLTYRDGLLQFAFGGTNATWSGKLDGGRLVGQWRGGSTSLELDFAHGDSTIKAKRRPQEPVQPYPYTVTEVKIESKPPDVKLAGTLTTPPGSGPFPAVVIMSGTGRLDRDGFDHTHKPFWILADSLTRIGIEVLRVDDRGIGKSTGNPEGTTLQECADDMLAAVEFLKKRYNTPTIGLIGYGEGGAAAIIAARSSNSIAFLALLSAEGLSGEANTEAATADGLQAAGASANELSVVSAFQHQAFAALRERHNPDITASLMSAAIHDVLLRLPEAERLPLGRKLAKMAAAFNSVWMRSFIDYNPVPDLRRLTCPVFAVIGDKDSEIPPQRNLKAIEDSLAGGAVAPSVSLIPGLNHLLQTCASGNPAEYEDIEETLSPVVLKKLGNWILIDTRKVDGRKP